MPMNSRGRGMCIAYQIESHCEVCTISRSMLNMHARRACRTAFFGATAAGAFLFVLRNSLGTWNVPNVLCRANTLWSCIEGDAGLCLESCCV
eukprot:scaffold28071_cov67-Phaeocystis_antarctica.AAC.3